MSDDAAPTRTAGSADPDVAVEAAEFGEVISAEAAIKALDGATRAIAGELDLDRVLQLIVDSVRDLVHARYAALGIVGSRGRIERFITSGVSQAEREAISPLPQGRGVLGLIIQEGRAYRIADISKHPARSGFPVNHPPMRSFLGVPIRTGKETIGNFYLTEKMDDESFSARDQRLVEMFALHAEIAIQNARLHTRIQQLAVLDERLRIGRDLHDGIIQGLYAVALSLEDVPDLMAEDPDDASARIDRAIDRLNTSIGEIRSFIMDLGTDPAGQSFGARLAGLTDELLLTSGGRMAVDHDLADADRIESSLSLEATSQLLQIAREALSNALRHSAAERVRLAVRIDAGQLVLSIEDDGRGFDPAAPRRAGHLGLSNLEERAASIGAALDISSHPGAGTRIIVQLPISPETRPT
ncbi:MAG: GAF domain-containing sensor histidine kinase [Chloroflexi bacterium]|nr:GAF domain-containing sensor histidine kinase [Chloroflexota bacterium]